MCKKVFIDTNIFISEKFMLSNHKFEKLKTYIENDIMVLLNNEITEKELEIHITKGVKEIINSYNKILNKSPFLEILRKAPIKLTTEDEKYIISFFETELAKFFYDSIKIPLDIDIKLILEDHFNLNLPFEKKKPNEFKDAFVIQMIKSYQMMENEKIYIISNDKGFRKTFNNNDKNFIVFEDLGKFIEKIEIEQLRENEKLLINEIRDGEINGEIEGFIQNYVNLEIDYDSSDYEIDNYEILDIYPEFIDSFEIENVQKYVFNIKLDIEIEVTYLDENSSYYDKEDKKYLFSNYVIAREKHNGEFKLVISVDKKDLKEINLMNEFISDYLKIDEKDSDMQIYLDDYTCEGREVLNETINNF